MARDSKVTLRVTEGTKGMWQSAARLEGRTLSNWIEFTLKNVAQEIIERHYVLWDEINLIDDGETLEVMLEGQVVALIPRNSKQGGLFSSMDPEDARKKSQPSSNAEFRSPKLPDHGWSIRPLKRAQ